MVYRGNHLNIQSYFFLQLLLAQCQWFGHRPYALSGYPYGAIPQLPNQPENIAIPANSNQPNIIIIKDDDDERPTKKDKFRFEEILTLLLTRHLGRDRDREREAPPQQSDNYRCCCECCCCKSRNDENGNKCSCCNDQNNNDKSNGNRGGTTMHITIVLPNNAVNKNDSK